MRGFIHCITQCVYIRVWVWLRVCVRVCVCGHKCRGEESNTLYTHTRYVVYTHTIADSKDNSAVIMQDISYINTYLTYKYMNIHTWTIAYSSTDLAHDITCEILHSTCKCMMDRHGVHEKNCVHIQTIACTPDKSTDIAHDVSYVNIFLIYKYTMNILLIYTYMEIYDQTIARCQDQSTDVVQPMSFMKVHLNYIHKYVKYIYI